MIVVVAAGAIDADRVGRDLRMGGASEVTERDVGRGRVLFHGRPFDDATAVRVAADLRGWGWAADVRPEGGGHLAAWHAHTRPVVIGGRLWVCLPWSEFDRDEADLLVEIDPGRAFGTGGHPTTRLLLTALTDRIQGGERVVDVGCGSGVLAIAAARLGAAAVTAVDIEPRAIAATEANAARNHVAPLIDARHEPVEALTSGPFDVIVANIHAAALIDLAPAIQSQLPPGGWLALSGLSPAQTSTVAAAYQEVTVISAPQEDDWSSLIGAKTSRPR